MSFFLEQNFINLELNSNNNNDSENLAKNQILEKQLVVEPNSFDTKSRKYWHNKAKEAVLSVIDDIKTKNIALAKLFDNDQQLLLAQKLYQQLSNFNNVVVLAVGGSSLGGKTFASFADIYHQKDQNQKVIFLESIDPLTIKTNLNFLDYQKTAFLIISKSGETIETICQTLIAIDQFLEKCPENKNLIANHFYFITENFESKIGQIAKSINAQIYQHFAIGGRYSCFSAVGLLPAFISGIDSNKIFYNAKKLFLSLENDYQWLIDSVANHLFLYYQGFTNIVLMPYLDNLKNFNDWYRQLVAESLGKNNFGFTPINSMGTADQHSQLQLYLEGLSDKIFSFIINKNFAHDIVVKNHNPQKCQFHNCQLSTILKIEQNSTIQILSEKGLPIKIINIDQLNEESLSSLMIMAMIEVIAIARTLDINPFDQPAVELRKNIAKEMLQLNK